MISVLPAVKVVDNSLVLTLGMECLCLPSIQILVGQVGEKKGRKNGI